MACEAGTGNPRCPPFIGHLSHALKTSGLGQSSSGEIGETHNNPGWTALQVSLDDTVPGTGHDQLAVNGTVNLGGATLDATLRSASQSADEFVIIANDGTDPIVGTFAGFPEGACLDIDIFNGEFVEGSERFVISYARGDGNDEASETFFVNLSAATGATLADDQGLGTIRNDDSLIPNINVDDAFVEEGINGQRPQLAFIVSLSGPSELPIEVDFSTTGATATSGIDFEALSGTLRFEPGEETKAIRVTVRGDLDVEAEESLFLNLDNPVNGLLDDDQAIGTIANDDTVPVLRIEDFSTDEGISGARTQFTFDVTLTASSNQILTVDYSTAAGTATSNVDFVSLDETLTFFPGETTHTITVSVPGDTAFESLETFFVNLSNPQGLQLADDQAIGRIFNDDSPTPILSVSDGQTDEGIVGEKPSVTFNLQLSSPPAEQITVDFATVDGTAESSNLDYLATNGTVTFLPGQQTASVTVTVVGDTNVETNETFFLNLGDLTGNAVFQNDQGIGFIINDDQALPQAEISDAIALEGDSGKTTFTFTITLDREADATATVDLSTANGTTGTSGGADVQAASGTVTFAPGEIQKTIEIDVVGDLTDEADEQFFVNLTNANGLLITDDQGRGIILNDDDPNAILAVTDAVNLTDEFGQEGNTGETVYEFTVQLIGKPAGPVTVQVSTQDGSAIAGQDYDAVSQQLTFNAGETTKKVQITVSGDQTVETDEFFFLNLSNPVGASIFDDQGIAAIINDDEVVNRDEGLELAEDVEARVEAALADPTLDSTVPGDGIRVVKGTNSGGRSDITDLLIQIGLDVIERLGLVDAIVAVFDPVNFIVTTPEGRANGFTENSGVVGRSTNSFYSGDGAVELLVIPNASGGIYNLELAGVNNGQFRAAVSRVESSGQIGTETIEGTLAGELQLALDFTRAFPNDPGRNAEAEAAFLALFQEFGGDSDAIDLALAAFTNAPKSNADQSHENAIREHR